MHIIFNIHNVIQFRIFVRTICIDCMCMCSAITPTSDERDECGANERDDVRQARRRRQRRAPRKSHTRATKCMHERDDADQREDAASATTSTRASRLQKYESGTLLDVSHLYILYERCLGLVSKGEG
jgi:hypothetical protein